MSDEEAVEDVPKFAQRGGNRAGFYGRSQLQNHRLSPTSNQIRFFKVRLSVRSWNVSLGVCCKPQKTDGEVPHGSTADLTVEDDHRSKECLLI